MAAPIGQCRPGRSSRRIFEQIATVSIEAASGSPKEQETAAPVLAAALADLAVTLAVEGRS